NQPLPWSAPPIARRTPPSSDDEDFGKSANGNKVIRLRMKRQRRRMVGVYRAIPEIDSMCRAVEDADYDKTDLFPLGLEPSDDEDATYPSSSILPTASLAVSSYSVDLSTQLYLIKKQLRLERHALLKQTDSQHRSLLSDASAPMNCQLSLDISHSWDDVTEFLMSEGFPKEKEPHRPRCYPQLTRIKVAQQAQSSILSLATMSDFYKALDELELAEVSMSPLAQALRAFDDRIQSLFNVTAVIAGRMDRMESATTVLLERNKFEDLVTSSLIVPGSGTDVRRALANVDCRATGAEQ
ncbi:unnamed protein product, partial [Nippostrongylus brasiliensis]|uniref:Conserved oligomeric Golgi complex subunit 7 n=1 Tax=Nippostrongylus brasiliensis TaxID=27835 RepID=A0A0N4YBU0_NIPBR